jgi:hypothetical protein
MAWIQPPDPKLGQNSFRLGTKAESDAPEVWPELDAFVQGKEHAIRIIGPLSKAFCQDCR